jgi:transcriptional regulator with XRE-family HTH domain
VKNNFEKDLKRIGQKIKEIRLEKKLTQSSLASFCDVDIRTIQRIEKGTFNMSLKIFFAISNSLEISPCELLNNTELDNKGSIYSE